MMREVCVKNELRPQPYLDDQSITPSEIASVLKTISQIMVSDGVTELAEHNATWFNDAAMVVEQITE